MSARESQIFREIAREYEETRTRSRHTAERRRDEVYKRLPRIREIDGEMAMTSVRLVREIALNPDAAEEITARLERESGRLQAEKKELLVKAGCAEDYLEPSRVCGLCGDTGYNSENKRCVCFTRKLIAKHYESSNLAEVLERENFDTFDATLLPNEKDEKEGKSPRAVIRAIFRDCQEFVDNFGVGCENYLFYGDPGRGKTFMCHCIAKALLDEGKSVFYVTSARLFKMLEERRFHRDEEEAPDDLTEPIYGSDLLIIDDLGTEFITSFTAAELFDIINSRALSLKPVIISTNLSLGDFNEIYSDRVYSRVISSYKPFKFIGADIRKVKQRERLSKGR